MTNLELVQTGKKLTFLIMEIKDRIALSDKQRNSGRKGYEPTEPLKKVVVDIQQMFIKRNCS